MKKKKTEVWIWEENPRRFLIRNPNTDSYLWGIDQIEQPLSISFPVWSARTEALSFSEREEAQAFAVKLGFKVV